MLLLLIFLKIFMTIMTLTICILENLIMKKKLEEHRSCNKIMLMEMVIR